MRLFVAPDPVENRWVMMRLLHHLSGDHTTLEVMHDEIMAHLREGSDDLPAPAAIGELLRRAVDWV